jgi:hypothetical protein
MLEPHDPLNPKYEWIYGPYKVDASNGSKRLVVYGQIRNRWTGTKHNWAKYIKNSSTDDTPEVKEAHRVYLERMWPRATDWSENLHVTTDEMNDGPGIFSAPTRMVPI